MGQLLSNRARKSRSKSRSISRGSTGDADSVSGDFDEQDHSDDDDFHSLKSMECTTPQQENLTDWSKYQNRPKEVVSDEPVCVDEDLLAVVKEDNALDASAGISASQVASGLGLKLVLDPKHAWADTTLLAKRSEHHRLLHSTDILDKVRKSHSADTQSEGSVTTLLMIAHEATQAIDNTVTKSKEGVLAPATAVEESTKENPPNNSKHVITEDIPDDNGDKEPVGESKISNSFEKFSDAESLAHQEPDEDISSRAHASIFQESRIQEKQGVSHMSPCEKDADQVTAVSDRLQLETTNDPNSVGKGKEYLRHRVILPLPKLRCRKGPKTMQKHAPLPSNTQSQLQSTATITNEGASNVPSGTLSFRQTNKISNERNVTGKEHEKVTSTITSDGSGTIVGVSDETSRQKHLERADNVRTASASAARSSDATQSSAVSKSSDQNKQSRQLSSYSLSHECDKALQGKSHSDSVGLINRDHTISGTPRVTAKKVQNLSRAQTADSLETSKSSKRPRPALENSAAKHGKRMVQRKSDKDDDQVAIISSGRPDDYICLFCQFEIFCRGYKEAKRIKGYYKRKKEEVEQSHEAPIAEAGSSSSSSATSGKRLIGL